MYPARLEVVDSRELRSTTGEGTFKNDTVSFGIHNRTNPSADEVE